MKNGYYLFTFLLLFLRHFKHSLHIKILPDISKRGRLLDKMFSRIEISREKFPQTNKILEIQLLKPASTFKSTSVFDQDKI